MSKTKKRSASEIIIRMVVWLTAGLVFGLLLMTVPGGTIALNSALLGGAIAGVVAGMAGSIFNRLWAAVVAAIVFGIVIGMISTSITWVIFGSINGLIFGVIIEPIVGDGQGWPDNASLLRVLNAVIGGAIGVLIGTYTAAIVEPLFKSNAWQIVMGLVGALIALVLFDWLLMTHKKASR